ncbi:hypothetical protein BCR41DRAFT_419291 [Lobosporangium transversale]|uniref:Uncharacterized protein n=1 Tax=Lobosporangium transversale TaxID=64571 RepID=A0A1Y2GZ03_9FUNG|nr:hypothetical protein BCR41DRAFT_419291 [Lobosporangium transversale]ORZ27539.1 hypothetical protein BCR41DRAFT_419291 [Lobosporangium transversale]|eukprot:XP_021885266.1 hypothetical protein BCR41DRAFT_419291 [Lobosporangium transversale]
MNTTIYASAKIMLRKVMAGVSTLIAILVFVEMIGSIRIGREQRRILKQEKRCLESAKIQENNNSNDSNTTVDGNGQDHSSGIISARGGESCERLIEKDSEGGVMVEIIRPEEVDPAMVIYDQRIMHELCQQQQQYRQQYQHYLEWMTVSALTSIQSSFKLEIPMNEPFERSTSPSSSSSPPSPSHLMASIVTIPPVAALLAPMTGSSAKMKQLFRPTAPPATASCELLITPDYNTTGDYHTLEKAALSIER